MGDGNDYQEERRQLTRAGGQKSFIPYGRQLVDDEDVAAVVEAMKGERLTQGPLVEEFERELALYCGSKHAVAVTNGTAALQLALSATGLGQGDEGITSPITFIAGAHCMISCGARPVFADIDRNTLNIDPAEIEKKVTEKTRVIMPVHFAGLPCEMEAIREIAAKRGITIIEDACHGLGGTYGGERIGATHGTDMVCFSFHPVKHITTGEGGAVLTENDELAAKLKRLRHHGITRDADLMTQFDGPWYYEAKETGTNARLTDVQCALGLSQLRKLDRFLERRLEIAQRYLEELADIEGLRFQKVDGDRTHAYHLFVIHLDPRKYDRLKVFRTLTSASIGTQVHYIPVNRQPSVIEKAGFQGSLHNADDYYAGCLSLPIFPGLSVSEQDHVISVLKTTLQEK